MSIEKQIIKDCIKDVHFMDVDNISNLIESYIYQKVNVEEVVEHTGDIILISNKMRFDKKDGLSQVYYQPLEMNGGKKCLSMEKEYKNDILDGCCKTYFPSGKVCDIYYYKNGEIVDRINFKMFNN